MIGNFFYKNCKYIILICCLTLFGILTSFYYFNNLSIIDNSIYSFIISFKSNTLTLFMKFISFLCNTYFLIIGILFFLFISKDIKNTKYISLNLIISSLLNHIVKIIVKRPRPIDLALIKEIGFSFPSGHSMNGIAYYGFYIYIIIHMNIKKEIKIVLCSISSILIILIGISRIYLGVHYLSDVLAGFSLGLFYLILYIDLIKYINK